MWIASSGVPSRRTLWRSRTPASDSAIARLSAVCPPRPARSPSGFSRAMTASIAGTVSGSRYTASATVGSVMIVAGFELTRIVRTPSARSARHAWVPA